MDPRDPEGEDEAGPARSASLSPDRSWSQTSEQPPAPWEIRQSDRPPAMPEPQAAPWAMTEQKRAPWDNAPAPWEQLPALPPAPPSSRVQPAASSDQPAAAWNPAPVGPPPTAAAAEEPERFEQTLAPWELPPPPPGAGTASATHGLSEGVGDAGGREIAPWRAGPLAAVGDLLDEDPYDAMAPVVADLAQGRPPQVVTPNRQLPFELGGPQRDSRPSVFGEALKPAPDSEPPTEGSLWARPTASGGPDPISLPSASVEPDPLEWPPIPTDFTGTGGAAGAEGSALELRSVVQARGPEDGWERLVPEPEASWLSREQEPAGQRYEDRIEERLAQLSRPPSDRPTVGRVSAIARPEHGEIGGDEGGDDEADDSPWFLHGRRARVGAGGHAGEAGPAPWQSASLTVVVAFAVIGLVLVLLAMFTSVFA